MTTHRELEFESCMCSDAIEFVWEVDPKDYDFESLAAQLSADGAVTRQFLKQLQVGASHDVGGARPTL